MADPKHTVEKIGGTSMSRLPELRDTLFARGPGGDGPYQRIFVVSAFGGITDLLLEHKKTGAPGVYRHFADGEGDHAWHEALDTAAAAMRETHLGILEESADQKDADDFLRERIEGVRSCLIDLRRLCSYGHFRLTQHMMLVRELLAGLGEAHSAFVATTLLRRAGINARFVDLSGWRDEAEVTLGERIAHAFDDVDLESEMPIVTGYAQCSEGLMREFDRGYSEVTFSRIAAHTGAREAIIHKEFHLSSADPRLVGEDAVRKIGHTNYDVADQLSNMGMEAIHPKAAKTLRRASIPLRVTNAFDLDDPGTLIDEQDADTAKVEIVTGLGVVALRLFEQDMVGVKGYDQKILEILTKHRIRIVSKSTNANTITHYLDGSLKAIRRAEQDLNAVFDTAEVTVQKLALVSVIGRSLDGLNAAETGLGALREAGLSPLAVQHLPGSVDVQFLLNRADEEAAVKALHRKLVETERHSAPARIAAAA